MKFNHLNVPTHWRNYWTRYPEGHTILEALIQWVSQVDSMVDNQNTLNEKIDEFVGKFDERLQDEVTQTLTDWQESGFIDVVISAALQWELDDYKTQTPRLTTEEKTLYVNSLNGNDSAADGTQENPFQTIQAAYDSIPTIITEQYTIQLADGIYNQGKLGTERPAVLYAEKKYTGKRTDRTNNALSGGVVIKGNPNNRSAVIIETSTDFPYGVYNVQGQLSLEDIVVKSNSDSTVSLLVSHRQQSYVHCNNVTLDGNDQQANYGAYTESGGAIEFTGNGVIKGCVTGATPITRADTFVLSAWSEVHDCETGILNTSGAYMKLTGIGNRVYNCGKAFNIGNGGVVEVRSTDSDNRIQIESPIEITLNGYLYAVSVDIHESVLLTMGEIRLVNTHYQKQILARNSQVFLRNTISFISPNTANSHEKPLLLLNSQYFDDGGNTVKGSMGGYIDKSTLQPSIGANGQTITITSQINTVLLSGGSSHKTGVTLSNTNIPDGQIIHLFGYSWGVELVDGDTAQFVGGSLDIGSSAGKYAGATLVFSAGKWREISRSLVRP